MSATQSQGISIAFRTPQTGQFHKTVNSPVGSEDNRAEAFMDSADREVLTRFGEQIRQSRISISPEEFQELRILDEFMACHVQHNKVCDVQCMYLWNEWVREFRSRSRRFPKLILEKEFRKVITDVFGVAIIRDGSRGSVYPGLRFVP
jgi:hypothetical protein